jgi:hypothetical protein
VMDTTYYAVADWCYLVLIVAVMIIATAKG